MAELEQNILELLRKNGMDYTTHPKLAEGIQGLLRKTTLENVKDSYLNTDRIKHPVDCPICEKNIEIHGESLNKQKVELLIKACRIVINGQKYFHAGNDLGVTYAIGGGWAKLKHWGLIEQQPNPDDPEKFIKGMWTATEKAMLFIGRQLTLPSKVYLYNSRLISEHRKEIDVVEAIGDLDTYNELMGFAN